MYLRYKEHFTFHLQYKHSGAFANRKYEELSYPILVALFEGHVLENSLLG